MLRSSLSRPFKKLSVRPTFNTTTPIPTSRIHFLSPANKRPALSIYRIATTSQYATKASGPPYDRIDPEAEKKLASQPLEAHPDQVSAGSSVQHVFEQKAAGVENKSDTNMGGGMRNDLVCCFDYPFSSQLTNYLIQENYSRYICLNRCTERDVLSRSCGCTSLCCHITFDRLPLLWYLACTSKYGSGIFVFTRDGIPAFTSHRARSNWLWCGCKWPLFSKIYFLGINGGYALVSRWKLTLPLIR